ncbi:MAG TPA: amylo-alpha-1,6-glucosidase [Aromatoleum sp.]|uniref:amylo-alpha-1,6-glucosidase n=1 Tax=Aromatoleum sp. TaxID=2307007 RepID=UPI002B4A2ED2|nr:amylo-alpha-1,6-glucosidase [Aromatoleum sp.]HJV25651.1 amylo-alpha-1,6-glucosidase [Aromatoleum sp.]
MQDAIQIDNRWYVLATSSRTNERTRVLKQGDTFALFDSYGDVRNVGIAEQGLYHGGTRFLSQYRLRVNGQRPLLLNSTMKEDNSLLAVDLANPDITRDDVQIEKGSIHVFRAMLLWEAVMYEHVRVMNYGLSPVELTLDIEFGADYADIFEVRGLARTRTGEYLAPTIADGEAILAYRGRDAVTRRTRIRFDPAPREVTAERAHFELRLEPKHFQDLNFAIACEIDGDNKPCAYIDAYERNKAQLHASDEEDCTIHSSNDQFNRWVSRSSADLRMLTTKTAEGVYPYAGVPWFSTPFGRDGIITALQYLWVNPDLACGVLRFLAATQAQEENAERDAEPGKILHETRTGELANLGEIPFERYYGSVDATPLFVVLAGAYWERTGDLDLIAALWPNIERALQWIDTYGDADGDGFVEYARHSSKGLRQQGWKDSDDSVFYEDGRLIEPPVALCEVQGYVYEAKRYGAHFASLLGHPERAAALERQADALRMKFNQSFWVEEMGSYALALDGAKRPCRVRASNAGHALFSGIAAPDKAASVARTLLAEDSFSGWGIRTLDAREPRYNPMSYHNGSIWPHDNALIAAGFARYGLKQGALRVLEGMFETSNFMDLYRLPELFCGFGQRPGEGPTLYPVACSPQAWASSTVFHLLQACLGLSFRPARGEIVFDNAVLPDFLEYVRLRGLRVADGSVDLVLSRHGQDVTVHVTQKQGNVRVVSVK